MITGSMPPYVFGPGAIQALPSLLEERGPGWVLWLVDYFFAGNLKILGISPLGTDYVIYVDTLFEPTVESVDRITIAVKEWMACEEDLPLTVIGIGGGSTMDTAKAVSILLTNPGKAEDYQGWDLVKNPAVYKIGVPTLSGTGSESSSTCVLTNHAKGLKLGMNSPYSRFDHVVLDPDLTATVPREQRFYTAMDAFCHMREYIHGRDQNAMVDALVDTVWNSFEVGVNRTCFEHYQGRESLMLASYFGGAAAGCTGLVHPFSAGLSMALGLKHGLANCVALAGLSEFYPDMWDDLMDYADDLEVDFPTSLCADLDDGQMRRLYEATVVHDKPLANALGDGWREILTREKVDEIFRRM